MGQNKGLCRGLGNKVFNVVKLKAFAVQKVSPYPTGCL